LVFFQCGNEDKVVPLLDGRRIGTAYRVEALGLSLFNLDEVAVLHAALAQLSRFENRISA